MMNMVSTSQYRINYKDGKFEVNTEGFRSNWIDIYDLVMFFKEAFTPELYHEISKRERGIVAKIGKRQQGIFRGMSSRFYDFLEDYLNEDGMELQDGVDSDNILIDYMNDDRKEFISSIRAIGLLRTIEKWLAKYNNYPIEGFVVEDQDLSEYIKRVK